MLQANHIALVSAQLFSCSKVVRQNSVFDVNFPALRFVTFAGTLPLKRLGGKLQYSSQLLSVQDSRSDKVFQSFVEAICSSSEHAEHAVPFPSEWQQRNLHNNASIS